MGYENDFCTIGQTADVGHIYARLQGHVRPHSSIGAVSLTFMCPNHPDIEIVVTAGLAEDLAAQLTSAARTVRAANRVREHKE